MPTKIEWCDESWNPVTGCDPVSEGCKNCYARRMARRLAGRCGYPNAPNEFTVTFHPNRLELPLHWKQPRMVFVNSMFDFYHPLVKQEWRDQMQGIMQEAYWHTYLILTKRPENIAFGFGEPNIWLGVTAENQWRADERIPILLSIPAAVHFVSAEPMLGPVDISWNLERFACATKDVKTGCVTPKRTRIDWVIAGPETGPGARECKPEWIYNLWQECKQAGVAFFDKRAPYLERSWPRTNIKGAK